MSETVSQGEEAENPFLGMDLTALREKQIDIEDRRMGLIDDLVGARQRAVEALAPYFGDGIGIPKRLILHDADPSRMYRPDDMIIIRIAADERERIAVSLRNSTLESERAEMLRGDTVEVELVPHAEIITTVESFIAQVDPARIGVHKLRNNIITEVTRYPDPNTQKLAVLRGDDHKMLGLVYYKEIHGSRSAYIEILATDPDAQQGGVGSRLLNFLKNSYEYLSLKAVPFTPGIPAQEASDRLKGFYKKRGFVAARGWSRRIPSLDDLSLAGEWVVLDYEQNSQVGIGDRSLSPSSAVESLLFSLATRSEIDEYIPSGAIAVARDWQSENGRIEEELEQASRDSQLIMQAIVRTEREERERRRKS